MGARLHPCFFIGNGFKGIIGCVCKELDIDFLWLGAAGTTLCFTGATGKFGFIWLPSYTLVSGINGSILWCREWGMGFNAASFNLSLEGSEGMWIPSINPFSLLSWLPLGQTPPFSADSVPAVMGRDSWPGLCLSLIRKADHRGGRKRILSSTIESLPCLVQKKRRRSASSFSKEATGLPWTLAMPSATKLRYEISGARCFRTYISKSQHINDHQNWKQPS